MTFVRSLLHYPLLGRELTERAARRRTYIVRVLFGAVLYLVFGMVMQRTLEQQSTSGTGIVAFGFGYDLLRSLVQMLAWSLLLIQPAIMAATLTSEKERDAFGLLLLTRLSPSKILLEKYLAGLFPTATLLLLALPLAAVTMSYGGVSFQLLVAGGMVLLATWLMVGAWALLCSAWCRTSLGAMLLAYLGGALLLFAAPLAFSVLQRDVLFGSELIGVEVPSWIWALWPGKVFVALLDFQRENFSSVAGQGNATAFVWEVARRCGALFAAAGVFLVLARVFLVRRAAAHPAGLLDRARHFWRLLPQRWRQKRAGHRELPGDAPIAWREQGRSLLGGNQQFIYSSVLICGATFAISIFLLGLYPPTRGPDRLQRLGTFVASAGMLVLVAASVSSLLSERANRTLDILFTTPLGITELIRQKAQAVSRYWLLFGALLAIIFGAQAWSEYEYVRPGSNWQTLGQQWATGLLALVIYPPLIIWTSFLAAAYWRKRTRAIFGVLGLFVFWGVAPLLILEFIDPLWRDSQQHLWHSLLSPLGILDANSHDRLAWFSRAEMQIGRRLEVRGVPWVPVAVNSAAYCLLAVIIRWRCLRSADRLLRR